MLQRLAWPSAHVPTDDEIDALTSRGRFPVPLAGVVPAELLRRSPRGPDWADTGFIRLTTGIISGAQAWALTGSAWMTSWDGLDEALRDPGPFTGSRPEPAEQVGFLVTTWDPLGIGGPALIEAEYDRFVAWLTMQLTPGTGPEEIAALLRDELLDHFGLQNVGDECERVANYLAAAATTWSPRDS